MVFVVRSAMSRNKTGCHSTEDPAIMTPMDSLTIVDDECARSNGTAFSVNTVDELEFESLSIHRSKAALLVDHHDNIKINVDDFAHALGCDPDAKLKVLTILGNSGDGKSYYLNNLLFKGDEVFKTSKCAERGTRGVWAAWHGAKKLLCLDTPPLHLSPETDILLMKVLAVSDAVVYRTRSERLPEDLFTFLGQAADAFDKYFKSVLLASGHRIEAGGPASAQGPAIFICHEPLHSNPLSLGPNGETPEDQIKQKFKTLGHNIDIFGNIFYVPTPSPFNMLQESTTQLLDKLMNRLSSHLNNTALRAPRSPDVILKTFKELLIRFRGRLTCDAICEACNTTCGLSIGHESENIDHDSKDKCRYQVKFENKILLCRKCKQRVKTVKPSETTWLGYAQSTIHGYELHCRCGVIYKSKQYWFGNQSPEDTAVFPRFIHVWSGQNSNMQNKGNLTVRKALEGVGSLVNTAYIFSTDYIAPSYWQPNSEISKCAVCKTKLDIQWGEVHHCRNCGKGVCNSCSESRLPVPHRGWTDPVRVCDNCKETPFQGDFVEDRGNLTPRKVSEAMVNVLKPLSTALNYPKGIITELARPSYWIPDEEAPHCTVCDLLFGTDADNARHHCRQCGQSVCRKCSPARLPVPERGWDRPVRVCEKCVADVSKNVNKDLQR